jgi:acetolactate synthase-1/2/3 large subunit
VHPASLLNILNQVASEVPVCADAGNSMCWAIELLKRTQPNDFHVSVDWGTMGFALPAAIGIALARRKAVIALTGDGSMAMAGGDLHTAVELALPVVLIVLNDCGAGMVDAGCRAWFGKDRVPNQRYRARIDFTQYGRSFGATAETITSAHRVTEALREALLRETPSVLDVHIDPHAAPTSIRARVAGLGSSAARSRTGGGMC